MGNYGKEGNAGDVIGVLVDLSLGHMTFYHNGFQLEIQLEAVCQGVAFSDLQGDYFPLLGGCELFVLKDILQIIPDVTLAK